MSGLTIRPLQQSDHAAWLPLWDGNNMGQRNAQVTRQTWDRLTDPASPVCGLGAFDGTAMVGLVHYILHPVTGHLEPVCYMQDVYVDPAHRQKGIGRALVQDVARIGRESGWARMYWLAEADNKAAQNLYKTLGVKLNFTLHVLPLGQI
jgi:ribosomal protein S18 acetylase RimI-like enzyme